MANETETQAPVQTKLPSKEEQAKLFQARKDVSRANLPLEERVLVNLSRFEGASWSKIKQSMSPNRQESLPALIEDMILNGLITCTEAKNGSPWLEITDKGREKISL